MTTPPAIVSPAAQPIDYSRLVACIAQLEGGNPQGPGGVLCWTPAAWKEESAGLEYKWASNPSVSQGRALARLRKMALRFAELGIVPTPEILASSWRWGFDGTLELIRHHVPLAYGLRAQNLYLDRSFVCRAK